MLGDAARLAVEIMDVLANRSFGVTLSSHVVNKEHTFLCHKCENLAEIIEALTKKVKSAESELVIMIEKHFMETIRKRNRNELAKCESFLPQNKRARGT